MIFTVGNKENYDRGLSKYPGAFLKKGRDEKEGYEGGWVWPTAEKAAEFCTRYYGYAVYALDAEWTSDDVLVFKGDEIGYLLRDAVVLGLASEVAPA